MGLHIDSLQKLFTAKYAKKTGCVLFYMLKLEPEA